MFPCPQALQCLVVAVAGWINQQQRDVIDYLQEENRVLREQFTCGWRIGKNSRVVRCARRPEPESSAKTAFVRCTIEAVPSVSQGGRAIGVERWRVLSNQIFSRFRRQAAIGV